MPHTSHKKKSQRPKRTAVTDADGWTRVGMTKSSQRKPQPLPAQASLESRYSDATYTYPQTTVPEGLTVERLLDRYRIFEKSWLESELHQTLEGHLRREAGINKNGSVDKCFVFGTSTFSGLFREWIDRTHVALHQLAAFLSVVATIEQVTGKKPLIFAQDPIYTNLDIDFLKALGVTTLDTPAGFETITTNSFVFTPNAELSVELRSLACNPAFVLTNSKIDDYWRNEKGEACTNRYTFSPPRILENGHDASDEDEEKDGTTDVADMKPLHELSEVEQQTLGKQNPSIHDEIEEGLQICEDFKSDKEVRTLPSFDAKDVPFYNLHLFYRVAQDEMDNEH